MESPSGLSHIELTTIADLLEDAASQYAEHGSNDYFVQASPANHEVLEAAIKFNRRASQDGDESTLEEVTETGDTLFIYDHWLMEHLADRCRAILDPKSKRSRKRTTKNSRLSDAELLLTADLLASLAENSYALYETTPGNEDLHLEPSPASTAFAAAVKRHAAAADAIAQDNTEAADSGPSVFVIDALGFLAHRCREAVGKPPAFDASERSAESAGADDRNDRLGILKTWMSEKILIERARSCFEEHGQGSLRVDAELETYARGGNPFKDFHDKDHPEAPPHALSVGSAIRSTISTNEQVVIKLFSKTPRVEWLSLLEQSTARRYWGLRIHHNRVLAVAGGESFDAITLLADCLYLGWMNEAKALAEIYRILYRKQRFNLNHQGFTLPLHHWLLRIAFDFWNLDFDGWGNFDGSKPKDKFAKGQCFGEPTLNEIFAHWRDVDLEPLRDRLIWLCDYYTHRTRYASEESREFASDLLHTRFPATILAWFRLRECLGLEIPTIDHPLMKPDYAKLCAARPFYTDDLIAGVLARLRREEIPDLGSFEDIDVGELKKWGDERKPPDFGDVRFVDVGAPGFGVNMEIPESWWDRSWDDALRLVDPITRTELSIIGYENPGKSYAQWAEVGLAAYRSAWPRMTRVKSAYEVRGSGWWGVAEEFRGSLPGAAAETHQRVVCFKHEKCVMLLVVAAASATFAANEKFYGSLIEWKVWTLKPTERGHRLAAEYQDIPGFARLSFWSALADPELQFQRGLLALYGRGGKLNELGPNPDPEFAVRWFLRAGNLGHPRAQFMLAILYSEGRGAAADIHEAIAWCKKSKAQGLDNAAKLLPALEATKRKQRPFWKFFS